MILVYGASGIAGSLVCKTLQDQDLEFVIAGRDQSRLAEAAQHLNDVEIRVAPIHDTKALTDIFSDADVVINCAGPFAPIAKSVVTAALHADSHYLDISGEQDFVQDIYQSFESTARKAQRVVVNGCAFEAALGDWAGQVAIASLAAKSCDSVSIAYAVDPIPENKGMPLSILASVGKTGVRWQHRRWVHSPPGCQSLEVNFPEPFGSQIALSFPSPEVITIPRSSQVKAVQTYLSIGEPSLITQAATSIAPVISPFLTPLLGSLLRSGLSQFSQAMGDGSTESLPDKRQARFAIVAEAHSENDSMRCTLSGVDIYLVTAAIVCLAAERLENEGLLSGVLTPSDILDPKDALEEISEQCDIFLELP